MRSISTTNENNFIVKDTPNNRPAVVRCFYGNGSRNISRFLMMWN